MTDKHDTSTEAVRAKADGWEKDYITDNFSMPPSEIDDALILLRSLADERDEKDKQIAELRAAGFQTDLDLQKEFRRIEAELDNRKKACAKRAGKIFGLPVRLTVQDSGLQKLARMIETANELRARQGRKEEGDDRVWKNVP